MILFLAIPEPEQFVRLPCRSPSSAALSKPKAHLGQDFVVAGQSNLLRSGRRVEAEVALVPVVEAERSHRLSDGEERARAEEQRRLSDGLSMWALRPQLRTLVGITPHPLLASESEQEPEPSHFFRPRAAVNKVTFCCD